VDSRNHGCRSDSQKVTFLVFFQVGPVFDTLSRASSYRVGKGRTLSEGRTLRLVGTVGGRTVAISKSLVVLQISLMSIPKVLQ